MESSYFAGSVGPLYGCYHAPQGRFENTGVVIATAHGHEYIQFHRVFLQLARMLSDAGFPVLRFDFSGCGDSHGGPDDWSLDNWREDLNCAVEHLRSTAGISQVGIVGLRLGASAACPVEALQSLPQFLVLWDAIVSGREYLKEIRDGHQRMLNYAHVTLSKDGAEGEEVLGFAIPKAWAKELDEFELECIANVPAKRVLIIESNPNHSQRKLSEALAKVVTVQHREFENPHLWAWSEDFSRVHIPIEILSLIVEEVRLAARLS